MSIIQEFPKAESLEGQLLSRIELRIARVAVVGLGYVGLPLAETFAWGGYPVVGYDIDPRDYEDPGATAVRDRVDQALHPGAIVSLHTGHRGTVDALDAVLTTIAGRGLAPVTVSTLLEP